MSFHHTVICDVCKCHIQVSWIDGIYLDGVGFHVSMDDVSRSHLHVSRDDSDKECSFHMCHRCFDLFEGFFGRRIDRAERNC